MEDLQVHADTGQVAVVFRTLVCCRTDKVSYIGKDKAWHDRIQVNDTENFVRFSVKQHIIDFRIAMIHPFAQFPFPVEPFLQAHRFSSSLNFVNQLVYLLKSSGAIRFYCLPELFEPERHIVEVGDGLS